MGTFQQSFDPFEDLEDEGTRPRSRLILQELAAQAQEGERDAFTPLKSRVSGRALRGLALAALTLFLAAFFLSFLRSQGQTSAEVISTAGEGSQGVSVQPLPSGLPSPSGVWVHVAGAVHRPGVYELAPQARVFEALEAAGGAREDAALDSINLAQTLVDGSQIYVPVVGETLDPVQTSGTSTSGQVAQVPALVNLNTASQADLEALPRIGPATAQKIIEYRQSHGPFTSLEDLLAIPGIGEKTLENLRDRVTL